MVGEGGTDAAGGFVHRFGTEFKGLVVDGDEVPGPGVAGHCVSLLRGAVGANPRVVGADGHEDEVGRETFFGENFEGVGLGGIAGIAEAAVLFLALFCNDVAVVAAVFVFDHAGAPVVDFDGGDGGVVEGNVLPPSEFVNVMEMAQEVSSAGGRNDRSVAR